MEYRIALPEEREKLIDFANYVFSQAHEPHDFKTLLPKEYADHVSGKAVHYIACREDGCIRAMVANRPLKMRMGNHTLNAGFIGTVSVHPYARGEGHMKHLMHTLLEDAQTKNTDMLVLGGLRQRYGYFGFELSGAVAEYEITETNIRHTMREIDASDITFENLTRENARGLDFACALANARCIGCERSRDEFSDIMHSWNSAMRLVLSNGEPIGYVMGQKGSIHEIGLQSEKDFYRTVKALFQADGTKSFTLSVAPYELERARLLGQIAESCRIVPQEMIRVFNWKRVLEASLNAKAAYTSLQNGAIVLEIDQSRYSLIVENGNVKVESTDAAPDRVLDGKQAVRMLFGVESAIYRDALYQNWTPLPLFFAPADTF